MEEVKSRVEPGIYYVDGAKVITYEETTEEELLEVAKVAKELIRKYGGEGWI